MFRITLASLLLVFTYVPAVLGQVAECVADKIAIKSPDELKARLPNLESVLVEGMDLTSIGLQALRHSKAHCAVFLGNTLNEDQKVLLKRAGATVVDSPFQTPYAPFRTILYSQSELETVNKATGLTLDETIYEHFKKFGKIPSNLLEAQSRGLHDQSIDNALLSRVAQCRAPTCLGVIGITGGSSVKATDAAYEQAARLAYRLGSKYLVATGGGPGIMEAANLGALMSGHTEQELLDAIAQLKAAVPTDPNDPIASAHYLTVARHVRDQYAAGSTSSLGVPTWFYGSEPTNVFATDIAKYFSNGIREERLLEKSRRGVIFVFGSAGTRQEIFMTAAQNHYATFGQCAPMVFLGNRFVVEYAAVQAAADAAAAASKNPTFYGDLIAKVSTADEAFAFIENHPPYGVDKANACIRPASSQPLNM